MADDTDNALIDAVEDALATLVADGSSPTQLHVAALRRAYTKAARVITARRRFISAREQ